MSVIKNKRSVSKYEFAYQFGKLYDFATLEISKMPKRRREYISAKIMEPLNEAIDYIGWLNDPFWLRKIDAEPQELVKKIHDEFLKLNKALLVACNAKAFPVKRLLCWQNYMSCIMEDLNNLITLYNELFNEKYKRRKALVEARLNAKEALI